MSQKIINVYTDGSCQNNGSPHARAGYAVYFGENDEKNEYGVVKGKQSNNTGELTGFIRALELVSTDIDNHNNTFVNIYTDSEYVIKCISSYGDKLFANNWKTSNKKDPPNKELLQRVYSLYRQYKEHVKVHHIRAHTDKTDIHSIGNNEADRLANLAIGVTSDTRPIKHYIDIEFRFKDKAKELGARWDQKMKKWYYTDDLDDNNKMHLKHFQELYLEGNVDVLVSKSDKHVSENIKKIYLKIPFQSKNAAKTLGARWDPNVKSWFYFENISQDKIDKLKKLET